MCSSLKNANSPLEDARPKTPKAEKDRPHIHRSTIHQITPTHSPAPLQRDVSHPP